MWLCSDRLTLTGRSWTFESCGAHHHRDINEAATFGAKGFEYSPHSALHRTVGRTGDSLVKHPAVSRSSQEAPTQTP
jgi:transposase